MSSSSTIVSSSRFSHSNRKFTSSAGRSTQHIVSSFYTNSRPPTKHTIRNINPSGKMKFTIAAVLSLATFAMAAPSPQNAGRPVPNGACCVANTSLKQDVCNVNGQSGRCVPSGANNCKCLEPKNVEGVMD